MASSIRSSTRLAAALFFWLLPGALSAETILFANGSLGSTNANPISTGHAGYYAASNPFAIAGGGTFNRIEFEHWITHGTTPSTVTWRISDAALFGGSTLATGSALLDWDLIGPFSGTLDVYRSSFSVADFAAVSGQTYWLTLYETPAADGSYTNWGRASGGAGNVASLYVDGSVLSNRASHYFQLSYAVPEPSATCLIMAGSMLVLVTVRRRR